MTYLNEQELNSVKGLMHYLNNTIPPIEGLTVEVELRSVADGFVGRVTRGAEPGDGYVFTMEPRA